MAQRKPKEWERTYKCAPAVLDVIMTYKDSTRRNYLRYGREYCEKLKDVQDRAITQALSIYHKKAEDDKVAPHPNYFIVTSLNLDKEIFSEEGPLIILGRLI